MARKYHSVLERIEGKWTIQFGDYDKEVAKQELQDMHDSGAGACRLMKKDLRIITTAPDQASIEAAVAKLNK
jgi:hypothetical protein